LTRGRFLGFALAGLAYLAAQFVVIVHGAEAAEIDHSIDCEACLSVAPVSDAPPPTAVPTLVKPANYLADRLVVANDLGRSDFFVLVSSARAPPAH